MLEIPESKTIGYQAAAILTNKKVKEVVQATSPHRFTWYNGDPMKYADMLTSRKIIGARGHGSFVDLQFDHDINLSISDGVHMKYYPSFEPQPKKHQLLIVFEENDFIAFTVSMYGSIFAYRGKLDNPYHIGSLQKTSPLDEGFNREYFESIKQNMKKDVSVKAFLATEQRIPGLGNGVLQDILFKAGIHPKRKISTLSGLESEDLFHSLKITLESMTEKGGRDTEKDFYGNYGSYCTLLSKNTYKKPCPNCSGIIMKEAYLGGTIYYCPACQPLTK